MNSEDEANIEPSRTVLPTKARSHPDDSQPATNATHTMSKLECQFLKETKELSETLSQLKKEIQDLKAEILQPNLTERERLAKEARDSMSQQVLERKNEVEAEKADAGSVCGKPISNAPSKAKSVETPTDYQKQFGEKSNEPRPTEAEGREGHGSNPGPTRT